jgi:hypothetical protein
MQLPQANYGAELVAARSAFPGCNADRSFMTVL